MLKCEENMWFGMDKVGQYFLLGEVEVFCRNVKVQM